MLTLVSEVQVFVWTYMS